MELNEIMFGTLEPQEKLERIRHIPAQTLLKFDAINPIMKRIIKECADERGDFRINSDRRVGNNWNSTVDGIREYHGDVFVDVYLQNTSTDTNTLEQYADFLAGGGRSTVQCHVGTATYDKDDKAKVVRGILAEYVYYKYIEKDERERQKRIDALKDYKILNPLFNHYYEEWRLDKTPFSYAQSTRYGKLYYKCKEAVVKYIDANADELLGKSKEELTNIYDKVWNDTAKEG